MGIDTHGLNFLRFVHRSGDFGQTLTIGRQRLFVPGRPKEFCEDLLKREFGASSVDSIDNSDYEQATLVHDMNQPLPDALAGRYDTVIDGGSLEHIFNVPQALRNISTVCKPGAQVIHLSPSNNFCGHGFWQFSPELFLSLYSERNGYRDTEVYLADRADESRWFQVLPPAAGARMNVRSETPLYALVRCVRGDGPFSHDSIQQSDYLHVWKSGGERAAAPRASLFAGLFRRKANVLGAHNPGVREFKVARMV